MAFTLAFYENPTLFAVSFPPPAQPFVVRCVEAADAATMQAKCAQVLAEIQALNALILAAFPQNPEIQLTLGDVEFAGGGDGHTFVTTLFFFPSTFNGTAQVLELPGLDFLPENFEFFFALASDDATLASEIQQTVATASRDEDFETIFQFTAGAAKGTRFMFGMAGFPEGETPQ